ncbi:MAG: hypothetical protein RL347_1314 [Actinomycetota bacterium]|jgi:lysophospholipase L1-like esterase
MLRAGLVMLTALLLTPVLAAGPAHARPGPVVAVGDSYMAGIGAGEYAIDDGCRRSARSYAADAARRTAGELVDESCPGARVPQALAQVAAIPTDAGSVLVQVGGNDIGFADLALACLLPFNTTCLSDVAAARKRLPVLTEQLAAVATEARARAPEAEVVMAGYPRLLASPRECSGSLVARFLTSREISAINALQARLDSTIRAAATKAGVRYVDWPRSVDRHSLCSADPWFVTPLNGSAEDSLHPTVEAYAAMGREVTKLLRR